MRPGLGSTCGWLVGASLLLWLPARAQQAPTSAINQIQKVEAANGLVRITCSQQPNFTTLTLSGPPRLVVDFADSVLIDTPHTLTVGQGALASVQTEGFRSDTGSVARVVIEMVGEADTDIEVEPGNRLSIHVTPVKSGGAMARGPAQPRVEVVSADQLQARADARVEAAAAERSKAEAEARAATEAKTKADGMAASDRQARAEAEARARQEADARAAAEAKAKDVEARLAQLEAANRAAEEARAAAEAKVKQEEAARAAAEAQAARERQAADQAKHDEAARAEEAEAAQQRASDEKRRADAAHRQELAAEESARRAAQVAKDAEAARQQQSAEAATQTRLAQDARQKQLAAEEAQRAERDRLAQLEKQRQSAPQQSASNVERAAAAESKAEARQLEKQRQADRQVAEAERPAIARPQAMPVKSIEAPAPPAGPTKDISLVGFRQTGGSSLVFVRASDVVRYSVTEADSNRVVLELENSRISERNGTRPLDTSFFDGPVTLISPSEDRRAHTVRVEIDLREMVPYETRLEGTDVVITFQG